MYNLDECLKIDENKETRPPGQRFPCFFLFLQSNFEADVQFKVVAVRFSHSPPPFHSVKFL